MRQMLAEQWTQMQRNPSDLRPLALLFHRYQSTGDVTAAHRVLDQFREKNPTPPAATLALLAAWYTRINAVSQAAKLLHSLYLVDGPNSPSAEKGLAGLTRLLLQNANEPIALGHGDVDLLSHIGKADTSPGFLNGILSLVLNSSYPSEEVNTANQRATAYFHRAKAEELLALLSQRFPNSPDRPALQDQLIEAYFIHRELDAAISSSQQFLTAFPSAPQRTMVALRLANAYAGKGRTNEEFALYQQLLVDLAPANRNTQPADYTRVLDQAIARYVTLKRLPDALALLRKELDRRPNDPAMYEKLAGFLNQNKMGAEVEAVYRRAMQQFPQSNWSHRLARYYLSLKRGTQYDALSKEVAAAFSGTNLEAYLNASANDASYDPILYRQVNLYAYQRFPHHIPFVKNLLRAHQAKGTANPIEYEALLRRHWSDDAALRDQFFSFLSQKQKAVGRDCCRQGCFAVRERKAAKFAEPCRFFVCRTWRSLAKSFRIGRTAAG